MDRHQSHHFYGLIVALTGVFISFLSSSPSRPLQYILAIGMFMAAIFAFLSAARHDESEIPVKSNLLHGVGTLLYGLAILFFGTSFDRFATITYIFLIYFGVTELIFGSLLYSHRHKIPLPMIFVRVFVGFCTAIGAGVVMFEGVLDEGTSLLIAGILLIISGINFMLYARQVGRYEYF